MKHEKSLLGKEKGVDAGGRGNVSQLGRMLDEPEQRYQSCSDILIVNG